MQICIYRKSIDYIMMHFAGIKNQWILICCISAYRKNQYKLPSQPAGLELPAEKSV